MGQEERTSGAAVQDPAARRGGADTKARRPASIGLQIEGAGGLYSARSIDLTGQGAYVWITDERFASPREASNIVAYGEKVASEFEGGMRIRLEGSGVFHEAEVVAVDYAEDQSGPLLVACHFVPSLGVEECQRLKLEPEAQPSLQGARGGGVARRLEEAAAATRRPSKLVRFQPAPAEGADTADLPAVPLRPPVVGTERRRAPRTDRILVAEVGGEFGTFRAHILNVSFNGALLTISDPAFTPPTEPDQLVLFTKRLGLHFGSGMTLRLLESGVSVKADVVRVSEKTDDGTMLILIGVKFRRDLTHEECARVGVRPDGPEPPAGVPAEPSPQPSRVRTQILELMTEAMRSGATDLHIKVGGPPRFRRGGRLMKASGGNLGVEEAHEMALELLTESQAAAFERDGDVELARTIEGVGRFRVNVLRQRGLTGIAIRCIPSDVPQIDQLGLSPLSKTLAEKPRGLVLVTGPTGSGKSTTLAALIDHINRRRPCHIITMEDPIEYLHGDILAHVTQREIGHDSVDFRSALKRALRQDPDVIMVGEMRDLETIALALTAAETGHLVLATLHTTSASLTPDRIVDVFPADQQAQIRTQLADTLQGVIAQVLVPCKDGKVALAQEVMVVNDAIRALIREHKTPQIANVLQTGGREGMYTLESSLNDLLRRGLITYETALAKANAPRQIQKPDG